MQEVRADQIEDRSVAVEPWAEAAGGVAEPEAARLAAMADSRPPRVGSESTLGEPATPGGSA
jgi:hypothetical protein